jgi:hypothetical protein
MGLEEDASDAMVDGEWAEAGKIWFGSFTMSR